MTYQRALRRLLLSFILFGVSVGYVSASSNTSSDGNALNFRDAEIALFIEAVSEITGKSFVVDPRVKGNVTVVSNQSMSDAEIYDVFLSVLDVNGFVALPVGKSIKIVPNVSSRLGGNGVDEGEFLGTLVTQVIKLEQASAVEIVPLLRPLLPLETHFAALETSNQLVISTTRFHAERISSIISRLDRPDQTYSSVLQLSYIDASELEALLEKLQSSEAGRSLRDMAFIAENRSNSIIIMGSRPVDGSVIEVVRELDQPSQELQLDYDVKVYYLEYADAEKIAPVIEKVVLGGAASQADSAVQSRSVQADAQLNALIIAAPRGAQQLAQRLVEQLDVRRAQILVEAVIAEISSKRAAELGMQWALANDSAAVATNFSDNNLVSLLANPLSLGNGVTLGVGNLLTGSSDGLAGILRALETDSDTNIVSTPSVVTLDNEEAEIVVGQNVPFITGQYASTANGSSSVNSPFQTIERENVGVKLKIRPKVNGGDAISLSIVQEVSSVDSQSVSASDVVTNTRSINTNVIANNGNLIILGGLIDDQIVDSSESVPILGDLPILGPAFKYKKSSKTKRNLMVFIKPTIIRDSLAADSISREKYQYLRAQQILFESSRDSLLDVESERSSSSELASQTIKDAPEDLSGTPEKSANW